MRDRCLGDTAVRQLVGLACVVLASGCDFTPVLDIPLPEHEQRVVLQSILVADSTVAIHVSLSEDPYRNVHDQQAYEDTQKRLAAATVELVQNGQVVERLSRPLCRDFLGRPESYPGEEPFGEDERCGPYKSEARTEAGGTYTLRVRVEGAPEASATATVPERVEVSEVEAVGEERVAFRLRDPVGLGHHYALQLSPVVYTYENTYSYGCGPPDYQGCRDTTVVERSSFPQSFRTRDPFLITAARAPGDEFLDLVAFDDQTFDGTQRTFTLEPNGIARGDGMSDNQLWLISLDANSYDAYQAAYFSLGDDNPFEEPSNLPSNVVNGYGIVGAATIHARALPESAARRAGA